MNYFIDLILIIAFVIAYWRFEDVLHASHEEIDDLRRELKRLGVL